MKNSINNIINQIKAFEDKKTLELFKLFSDLKVKGFLTKRQALKILKWKSPRPLKY